MNTHPDPFDRRAGSDNSDSSDRATDSSYTSDSSDSDYRADDLAAVLFDMDGTLVDSERLWSIAMDRVAAELGGHRLPEEVQVATTGQSIPTSVSLVLDHLGVDADLDETTERLLAHTAEVFAAELLWQPGAEELLDAIRRAGLRTALVTNSPRRLVDVALNLLGRHRFDVTICGDEVRVGKPDPFPYVEAMRRLGVPPGNCLAVEDSPSGTSAAIDAGIPVLVVPSQIEVPDGPGRIFAASLLDATVTELHHIHGEFRRAQRGTTTA